MVIRMEAIRYENSEIDERIIRAVTEIGYEEMTPIQQSAIPALLEGRDIIGQAQTGTGKTAAFGIPLVQMIDPEDERVQAIVLCPTRELAIQAADELRRYAKYLPGVKVLPVYGGQDIEKQIRSLRGKVSIVVGTPGRVMDHMRRHTLKLEGIRMVVLDEADEMLNMGFVEDIETILAGVPENHQTALFSATMPAKIQQLANTILNDPSEIKLAVSKPAEKIIQAAYVCYENQKLGIIRSLFMDEVPERVIVFASSKIKVKEVAKALKSMKLNVGEMHSDLEQAQRETVMHEFKAGRINILVATDIVARGIDIDDIRCGKVTVSLLTDPRKHTNHREVLHGGVMMALADSVTGVTGASVGAVVVTVSLTMSFIRNARPGSRIRVKSHITHNGRTTIVIAAEMYDEDDKLMANILADMMIVDHFPEIPRKW